MNIESLRHMIAQLSSHDDKVDRPVLILLDHMLDKMSQLEQELEFMKKRVEGNLGELRSFYGTREESMIMYKRQKIYRTVDKQPHEPESIITDK